MKRGWGTCDRFKVFNLTYLHVLHTGIVYITLGYMHVPRYVHVPLGQNCIDRLTLHVHVPTYLLALHDFRPLFNSP